MSTRSEVIMFTNPEANKQTLLKTSNALRYAKMSSNQLFPSPALQSDAT